MALAPKTEIRRNILDVTRKLLIEQGITPLSIRMIAKAVGCSVGTIYFHFENKDVLIHSLIEEGFEKLVASSETAIEGMNDPIEMLKTLATSYIHFAMENPGYYEIMFMLKPERMARYPAEKYRKARRSITLIEDAVNLGIKEKVFQISDAYLAANLYWSFMHGVISLLQFKRIDHRVSETALIDAAINQIVQMDRVG